MNANQEQQLAIFPSPVSAGQSLTFYRPTELAGMPLVASIIDGNGRVLQRTSFHQLNKL